MRLSSWLFPGSQGSERRLRRVLRAALRDPYYRWLRQGDPVTKLERFPFTEVDSWKLSRRLPELPAVVTHPLIRQVAATRAWSAGRCSVAIAGTVPELLDVSRSASRSRPQVEFAVLAIERPGDAELTEESRDELWETFQVPVYRVLLGFDGRVLAHECEALRGLHAGPDALFEETAGGVYLTSLSDVKHPSVRLRIGLAARLEHGPCDCGRPGVRVAPVWQARERLSSAAD